MSIIDDLRTEATEGQSRLTEVLERLAKLAKRSHYICEDSWYSCPKADDGTCNDEKGDECDCGADDHNAEVDALLVVLRSNTN